MAVTSARQTPQLVDSSLTADKGYEIDALERYKGLQNKLVDKKALEKQYVIDKAKILYKVTEIKNRMSYMKQVSKKSEKPQVAESSSPTPPLKNAQFYIQIEERKSKIKKHKEKILKLREEANQKIDAISALEKEMEDLKYEIGVIREQLYDHYQKLLIEGKDTRNEGLCWIIKAIWELGKNVNTSKIPTYLDPDAVKYLFDVWLGT